MFLRRSYSLLSIIEKIIKLSSIYFKEAHKQVESLVPVCMVHQSQNVLGRFQRQRFHGISLATTCTVESSKDEEHDSTLKLAERQDIKNSSLMASKRTQKFLL